MVQIAQCLQTLGDDGVVGNPVQGRDKRDTAGVMFKRRIIEALSFAKRCIPGRPGRPGRGNAMSSCHGTNSRRRSRSAESVFSATVTAERHGSRANVHATELAGQHWPKVDGK